MVRQIYFIMLLALFVFLNKSVKSERTSKDYHLRVKKDLELQKSIEEEQRNLQSCTGIQKRSLRRKTDLHEGRENNSPRDVQIFGAAAYFDGQGQVMRLRKGHQDEVITKMAEAFTLEIWIKPEGGQSDPAIIIGLFDKCSPGSSNKGWSLGIHTVDKDGESGARVFFALKADRSKEETVITSHQVYQPKKWIHIAVSYDGKRMKLYIDSAKVAVGLGQNGPLYSNQMAECKELYLGGPPVMEGYFRGAMDELRLWSITRKHHSIVTNMLKSSTLMGNVEGLLMNTDFHDLAQWEAIANGPPSMQTSGVPIGSHDVKLVPPPCGQEVCDDPEVILSYSHFSPLRSLKRIRYRVINVLEDDGSNPIVSQDQIKLQHQRLLDAFSPYNISWELEIEEVKNTSLRKRTILYGCDPEKVGNDWCNPECHHLKTGNDGGDCDLDRLECAPHKIGDSHCDYECNRVYHQWDGGDCCDPEITDTSQDCFDPASNHRAYLSVNEYKHFLGFNGVGHLNVIFASWLVEELVGVATFPWEKEVYSVLGGTLVQPDTFGVEGKTDNLVHEFGHNLGLWHVHHGISEVDCNHACVETHPSLELGDLCSDTRPTPRNSYCRDPDGREDTCGLSVFQNTPFTNYMSYADSSCTDHFTKQQVARMHCYIDLVYQPWQDTKRPSPVPLAPRISNAKDNSVTLIWIPPLGKGETTLDTTCSLCTNEQTLVQYAESASSPNPSKMQNFWAPHQATGPPDAESCSASTKAWMPDLFSCYEGCVIEFTFKFPVIPSRLSLWVAWNAANGIKEIDLFMEDGSIHKLTSVPVFCDMPFTTELDVEEVLTKIAVYTNNPYVSIDAIQIESTPKYTKCKSCKKISYRLIRKPAFQTGPDVLVDIPEFTDRDVEAGTTYTYEVKALLGSKSSQASPTLTYNHGGHFCGDGKVDRDLGETCDDGNAFNGDGCNLNCVIEEFFHCQGEPSLCYRHDGDGICEEFEKLSSVQDCGFYTPPGFEDQWVISATTDPEYQLPMCPESVVHGPPPITQKCSVDFDKSTAWHPCSYSQEKDDFWLQVDFAKPVVATSIIIYLAADGITEFNTDPKKISLDLIDVQNKTTPLKNVLVELNCKINPVTINIHHDLSKPFFYTKGLILRFDSYHVAISAVALRSSRHLNPLTIMNCEKDHLYNPNTGQCVPYQCQRPSCDPYMIKYGEVDCEGHLEGDFCKIRCESGYKLNSYNNKVQCVNGEWRETNIKCEPVDCGDPQIPHAKVDCPDGTQFGSRCKFECKTPARKQGNGNSVTCEEDGLWSLPDAYCKVMCQGPPEVKNAALITKSCKGDLHEVSTKCKFRCNKGFKAAGYGPNRRILRHTCNEEGSWDGIICEKVTCPALDPVYTGLFSCTDETNVNSQCVLKCPGPTGAVSSVSCQASGKWDSNLTKCKFEPGECPTIQGTSDVSFLCHGRDIGSTCEVFCKDTKKQPMSRKSSNLLTNGKRVQRHIEPPILNIVCTGQKRWHPEPLGLTCVNQCSPIFFRDGFCDANNNHEHCEWDGGDCCASTVAGNVVKTYPEDCGGECSCKDPYARENKLVEKAYKEISYRVQHIKTHSSKDPNRHQWHRSLN